jgi:hypothetical protein
MMKGESSSSPEDFTRGNPGIAYKIGFTIIAMIARMISPIRSEAGEKDRVTFLGLDSKGVRRYPNETSTPNSMPATSISIMVQYICNGIDAERFVWR